MASDFRSPTLNTVVAARDRMFHTRVAEYMKIFVMIGVSRVIYIILSELVRSQGAHIEEFLEQYVINPQGYAKIDK